MGGWLLCPGQGKPASCAALLGLADGGCELPASDRPVDLHPVSLLFYLEPAPDRVPPRGHFAQALAQSGCCCPGVNSESRICETWRCLSVSAASLSINELQLQVDHPKGEQEFQKKKKNLLWNFSAKLLFLISVSSQRARTVSQAVGFVHSPLLALSRFCEPG